MNKAKVNYWIDLVIALAFVLSAVSGIVFLLPIDGSTVLGVPYIIWDWIHTWGSLAMIAGVLAHLVLHWKWLIAMTKKIFAPPAKPAHSVARTVAPQMSRRQFMQTAVLGTIGVSAAALGAGMTAISLKAILGNKSTVENQVVTNGQPEATSMPPTAEPTQIPVTTEPTQSPAIIEPTQSPATIEPTQMVTDNVVVQPEATSVPATVVPTTQPEPTSVPPTIIPTQNIAVSGSSQSTSVACHKGIAYDPYPGKCRHYVDNDGDGYCDLSIPT